MPRYFFHSRDGEQHIDDLGMELPHAEAASAEATRFLGELLMSRAANLDLSDFHVEVASETGLTLYILTAFVTAGAAVAGWKA